MSIERWKKFKKDGKNSVSALKELIFWKGRGVSNIQTNAQLYDSV